MKICKHSTKAKFLGIFKQSMPFRTACFLSILVHLLIFMFAAFFVFLFDSPDPYIPPLVFDFVFMPSEDYDDAKFESEHNKNKVQSNIKTLKSKAPPPPSREIFSQVEASETQPAQINENEWPEEVLSNPSFVPEEKGTFDLEKPYYLSVLEPSYIHLPRYHIRKPNLVPAKISMSTRQRKILLKKVQKMANKMHQLDWADSVLVWKDKGQLYNVKVRQQPAKTTTDLAEVSLEVTTQQDGHTLTTQMRMRRLAFSNFAQFVDYWDPYVAVHNDELEGRFHTNTVFNVSSLNGVRPKFHGKVTTAAYEVRHRDSFPFFDHESVFIGGIETGVREIRLPRNFLIFSTDSMVTNPHVHILTEDTWIVFNRDGTYSWRTASAPASKNRKIRPDEPFFIIGPKKTDLHIKGVVKGKVLVYSAGKIIIDDDLLYARHPEISFLSNDYLGLVCEKDIEIAHPSVAGPGDLQIFAAIYAKRRFRVRHLRGDGEATLYIYGSLTAGTLSATEPRYATRVRFDKRLETRRPPNFPMTNRYEMIQWDGRWKVKKP